jgi:hypothetical protein
MKSGLLFFLIFISLGVANAYHGFMAVEDSPLISGVDFLLSTMWCGLAARMIVGKK